mgnify:CR=1 FL=1
MLRMKRALSVAVLIASIIRHDVVDGSFTLREFYTRRLQRLLPNVIVTVGVTVLLWRVLLFPSLARQAAAHGVCALFSLSNVYVWQFLVEFIICLYILLFFNEMVGQ